MRPFRGLTEHPAYWSLNRRNVTRAFALGLFLSFVPLPIHMVLAPVAAIIARLNIAATMAGVLLTNPFTVVPLFFSAYWIGSYILGTGPQPFAFEPAWYWLQTGLLPVWKPFLLGCLVMGLLSAVIGYIALGATWHLSLVLKYRKRKARSATPRCAIEEK